VVAENYPTEHKNQSETHYSITEMKDEWTKYDASTAEIPK